MPTTKLANQFISPAKDIAAGRGPCLNSSAPMNCGIEPKHINNSQGCKCILNYIAVLWTIWNLLPAFEKLNAIAWIFVNKLNVETSFSFTEWGSLTEASLNEALTALWQDIAGNQGLLSQTPIASGGYVNLIHCNHGYL